jgi:3-hydroxyisobutyrate dehydrogenase-like beta-hydroxyacid dehydrogenase
MIGLGKMGAGMTRRLLLGEHETVASTATRERLRRLRPMAPWEPDR